MWLLCFKACMPCHLLHECAYLLRGEFCGVMGWTTTVQHDVFLVDDNYTVLSVLYTLFYSM